MQEPANSGLTRSAAGKISANARARSWQDSNLPPSGYGPATLTFYRIVSDARPPTVVINAPSLSGGRRQRTSGPFVAVGGAAVGCASAGRHWSCALPTAAGTTIQTPAFPPSVSKGIAGGMDTHGYCCSCHDCARRVLRWLPCSGVDVLASSAASATKDGRASRR